MTWSTKMKCHPHTLKRIVSLARSLSVTAICGLILSAPIASAQQFVIKPVVEKKLTQLSGGPLHWRLENFPTLALAQAAAGPTSLAAEVAGKVWLFTLGPKGGSTAGASKVAEIGPVPPVTAPEYLLRINHAGGPPGAKTPIHTHPGIRGVLRALGTHEPTHSARGDPSRRRPVGAGSWCRCSDGGLQQRHDRFESACHVPGRCDEAVLVAGQVRVRQGPAAVAELPAIGNALCFRRIMHRRLGDVRQIKGHMGRVACRAAGFAGLNGRH